jgi:hypothetical protein
MGVGSSTKSEAVGSGVGIEVGATWESGVADNSGKGVSVGSGTALISGVGDASGDTSDTDSWVIVRIFVTESLDSFEGALVGFASATTTSGSSATGSKTGAIDAEVSGKSKVENNAPAVPIELLDPSFSTDENSDPAEDPPTTKVVSMAAVSFEEVFTL